MTCIAGFLEGQKIWMGADSAGVGGYSLTVRADQKLFKNGPMLFGFTGSFRMGQLLRYALTIPDHDPRVPIEKYMATNFVNAVRECLKTNGFSQVKNGVEEGGTFLVGYKRRLFCIFDDYQVAEAADAFDAVGCGHDIAKGALFATSHLSGEERLRVVFQAAERYSAGVRGPFVFQSAEDDPAVVNG
jgi:ATP-dependent protease HslVU (ClpYQ) peptidase subunit